MHLIVILFITYRRNRSDAMVEIVLENLSKTFGDVKAVDNLNLKIKEKEFMVFLGPSGCGKTTLLRLIAGLEKPTNGKIYFDGRVVNDLEPKERNVAMVFQEYALYPHMTVAENMSLCLQVDKVPREKIVEKLKRTAEILQIEKLMNRKPSELSGGQQQRVALGRAIIRNPSVYLMDEPLSNLDAILRVAMRSELKKLHEKLKTTTIYVTHDQAEAMVLADRVAVLKDGKLLQVDKPRKIYDRPANKFIAEFVGSPKMNFIKGSVLEKNGQILFDAGTFSMKLNGFWSTMKDQVSGSELVMGVRPEHVHVYTKKEKDTTEAKIYFFQQMGNLGYVELEIGNIKTIAAVRADFEKNIGEKVFVKFDRRYVHFFDKVDEKLVA